MAHAYIAFYHGPGLPILYVLFVIQLGLFLMTEKFLLLKFYKKFNHIEPYVRQFIIHSILIMLFIHMFRAIDILGSEEIFPDEVKETIGLKSGTLLYYYTSDKTSYMDRLLLPAGIAYLLFSIGLAVFYALIWWSHRANCIGKCLSWCSLLNNSGQRAARFSSLKPKNLVYYPNTYQFCEIYKYSEALPPIEMKYVEASDIEARFPGESNLDKSKNVDSQYELKNSHKSPRGGQGDGRGPDVAIKSSNVSNIFKKKNNKEPKQMHVADALKF